jgi:hypothetical protein
MTETDPNPWVIIGLLCVCIVVWFEVFVRKAK